ncbi:ShlB/FhaC/HecB family hemolysin secretion/activation protein [Salmonella enterica subsp. enterica serovar Oranienburg]|uniref:ShlB/FhaC/HecB family hemolysin secretion/activation protein n=1 Tax=Salmonella enterica TaxID=28901 RepID=A0A744GEC8_SALER|nr:ShlB/FhaC/HecB family hemolysin secretion/activation protein [Salmonella enterica subsp. enterica serovar Oranienburg]EEB1617030.1 ShlB/FhaC/HecB family hemolysin secretion/activation protein [Salmonella enterica subsp. enterica serovar Enteritidis]HAF1420732.1 ShlB/FhaC/HecB family hemolysin secretion/activation protein [Salmonella enterica]EBY8947910.1 ShlB/FhaC/HecB family hemolysin secretion/activation protein [Salmonella enterica subsp. enterica serovar Oranienburg]EGW9206036.1 ShlB/Fha
MSRVLYRLSAIFILLLPVLRGQAAQPLLHQQARQKALAQQLTPLTPSVRLPSSSGADYPSGFPVESPCFAIHRVQLAGAEALPHWLPLSALTRRAVGQCLGSGGISLLVRQLQDRIVSRGWVTTRVMVPAQELKRGVLHLLIVPGRIGQVRLVPGSSDYVRLWSAIPAHHGDLLDLRAIEQGMENLQRPPTVQAQMQVVPGAHPGESDIVITRRQSGFWRAGLNVDDAGQKETGRYEGTATLWLDNPLSLSDTFFLSGTHDLGFAGRKNSQSLSGYYALPVGYWLWSLSASESDYTQTVAGFDADTRYRGRQKNLDMQLSRVLFRNEAQKNTLSYDVLARESRQYINDVETDVERTQTSGWRLGFTHRHYLGAATLDAGISWQRGTRWFGAQPVPGEAFGDATGLSKILTWNADLNVPFSVGQQSFRFDTQYLRQTSTTPLISLDQFSVGNRWTVRGFDGERTLTADNGWYTRNELAWQTPLPQQELYLGVDYGAVSGHGAQWLPGRHLAGGVLGLRGSAGITGVSYDLFVGSPLSKPDGFKTSPVTTGFQVSWQV